MNKMRNRLLTTHIVLVLFITCSILHAFTLDDYAKTVLCFVDARITVQKDGTKSEELFPIGSGFVISGKSNPFIVTASHVAKILTSKAKIIVNGSGNVSDIVPLSAIYDEKSNFWIYHMQADLAVLKFKLNEKVYLNAPFDVFSIPFNVIINSKIAPARDLDVYIMGFPLGLGYREGNFSPLSKQTRASSGLLTLNRSDSHTPQQFFILADPSIGGYSGSPVCRLDLPIRMGGATMSAGQVVECYGVIHGTLSDDTGGKMAAVTPAYYLSDLMREVENSTEKK
jgi:hypothetical protein